MKAIYSARRDENLRNWKVEADYGDGNPIVIFRCDTKNVADDLIHVIDLEDCREVYGDRDRYGEVFCPCDVSPSGQCEYDATDRFYEDRCIHCRRITG